MKILAPHLKNFIDYASLRGIPVKALTGVMRGDPGRLDAPDATVSTGDFYRVINYIAACLKDDLLGIRTGNHLNMATLGAIYAISKKAVTNEEALHYCHDYLRKTLPFLKIVIHTTGRHSTISFGIENNHHEANRLFLEALLTVVSREIRIISGEETAITMSSPYHHAHYPPMWEPGESYAVSFKQNILKAAIHDNSRWNLDILIPEYLSLTETLDEHTTFSRKVRTMALKMARPQLPELDAVADAFNLNRRALQRKLVAEKVTFRQLTDALKRDICNLLMLHDRLSVADIATMLGYAEPASFIHAFKKWHGSSPAKFKNGKIANYKKIAI